MNIIDRRRFLITAALTSAGTMLASNTRGYGLANDGSPVALTILHTNDVHSRIEPFPENAGQNAGLGGVARRHTLINKFREDRPNVLLFDAGDIFQGTPYFNFFGGELELKAMSAMGYDAGTLGNHDFDNGIDGLSKMLPFCNFPLLTANYNFAGTLLDGKIKPYTHFTKQGIKVGVFGLGIELKGLVPDALYGPIIYQDPVAVARGVVQQLQADKCDLIVCLSHLGYDYGTSKTISDTKLANQVVGIDLIIGGHTHTFLPKPVIVTSTSGHQTVINQVGFAGINLGEIIFEFAKGKPLKINATSSIIIDKNCV